MSPPQTAATPSNSDKSEIKPKQPHQPTRDCHDRLDRRLRSRHRLHIWLLPRTQPTTGQASVQQRRPEETPAAGLKLLEANSAREPFLNSKKTQRLKLALEQCENPQLMSIASRSTIVGIPPESKLDCRLVLHTRDRDNFSCQLSACPTEFGFDVLSSPSIVDSQKHGCVNISKVR